jgi:hypothetical protein
MAHRSDRRGATPITRLAIRAVQAIGAPRADFHDGPELSQLYERGRRYDCSPTSRAVIGRTEPRRSARVKALRPPAAVRFAQP